MLQEEFIKLYLKKNKIIVFKSFFIKDIDIFYKKMYNIKGRTMKKLAVFFLILVIIIVGISYLYLNYKASYNKAVIENRQFESYKNQEISGTELTTIINKAVDNNENNEVQKEKIWNIQITIKNK